MRIGVIGASGFVGSAIFRHLSEISDHESISILRGDDFKDKLNGVDFVIHSANPAKRFVANSNPALDRQETLGKTNEFLRTIGSTPILLISSISCRTQIETPYAVNRRDCEYAVLDNGGAVVRLGPMFGGTRLQDIIHDICAGRKVFVAKESNYSFSNVDWNGSYIANNFAKVSEIIEIGARNSIMLSAIATYTKSESEFSGEVDNQYPLLFSEGPDVNEVFDFVDKILTSHNLS